MKNRLLGLLWLLLFPIIIVIVLALDLAEIGCKYLPKIGAYLRDTTVDVVGFAKDIVVQIATGRNTTTF